MDTIWIRLDYGGYGYGYIYIYIYFPNYSQRFTTQAKLQIQGRIYTRGSAPGNELGLGPVAGDNAPGAPGLPELGLRPAGHPGIPSLNKGREPALYSGIIGYGTLLLVWYLPNPGQPSQAVRLLPTVIAHYVREPALYSGIFGYETIFSIWYLPNQGQRSQAA